MAIAKNMQGAERKRLDRFNPSHNPLPIRCENRWKRYYAVHVSINRPALWALRSASPVCRHLEITFGKGYSKKIWAGWFLFGSGGRRDKCFRRG